jgi:hypothetical protein
VDDNCVRRRNEHIDGSTDGREPGEGQGHRRNEHDQAKIRWRDMPGVTMVLLIEQAEAGGQGKHCDGKRSASQPPGISR